MGPLYLFRNTESLPLPTQETETPEREMARLEHAFQTTAEQIRALAAKLEETIQGKGTEILNGHLIILEDPTFLGGCQEEVSKNGKSAEWAVNSVTEKYMKIFSDMDDPYLRERAKDISDISRRLLKNLTGRNETDPFAGVNHPCIIVADDLSPSETISLPKKYVLGFAIDHGSPVSHSALLAHALGIPAIVGLRHFSEHVKNGEMILLDGNEAQITTHPTHDEIIAFEERLRTEREAEEQRSSLRDLPGETKDGYRIPLLANVDAGTPLADIPTSGAEGIGLYRSEYLWITLNREPTEEEQLQAYTEILRSIPSTQSTVFRVLDLGGDKLTRAKEQSTKRESNPFLGNRSIRYLLHRPDVFRRQLRAILRASAFGKVKIMYPMIATIEELRASNQILESVKRELTQQHHAFDPELKRGVMIEIPSAALIADSLAKEVDFFSIGTNDLVQYTLAVDRLNETVANLYQPTHPAVLQLIHKSVLAAQKHGIPISVCGEAASDPIFAVLLIGMGVNQLSMSPALLPAIKRMLRHITFNTAQELARRALQDWCELPAGEIYKQCQNYLS